VSVHRLQPAGAPSSPAAPFHGYACNDMLICMRTTLELPQPLWQAAKERAARQGSTLTAVVEAALRAYLGAPPARPRHRLRWRTESGTLLPGVDPDSRSSLYDVLGDRE